MKKTPRKKWGTNVAVPKPFTVFPGKRPGEVGVRIGNSKPFLSGREVSVLTATIVTVGPDGGLRLSGEGVVRKDGNTIRVTA